MPTTITVPGTGGGGGSGLPTRELLTGNRDYFVRTDGNNANDGRLNTAARAFQTIQYALNFVTRTVDAGGYNLAIRVADGTYVENLIFPPSVGGGFDLIGNDGSPNNVIIQGASAGARVLTFQGDNWYVSGFKVKLTGNGGRCIQCSDQNIIVVLGVVNFDNTGNTNGYVSVQQGPSLVMYFDYFFNPMQIYGLNWSGLFSCTYGAITLSFTPVNLVDAPAWSSQGLYASINAAIQLVSGTTGTATGKRYHVVFNSYLGSASGDFPGDVAGVSNNGGMYNGLNALDISQYLDLIGPTHGDMLYRNASNWVNLTPGTAGYFLKTSGAGGDPSWDAAPGATGGEANTGINIGTAGVGIFKQKSGVSLEFKQLNTTTTGLTITDDTVDNEVDITLNQFTDTDPGGVPLSGGGTVNYLRADGTWQPPPIAGGISDNDVTNAKLADMAANTFKGTIIGGDPEDLTPTNLKEMLITTSTLDIETFLRADGNWAIPPGTGSGGGGGSEGDATVVIDPLGRTLDYTESGTTFTDEGASVDTVFILPAASIGKRYSFITMNVSSKIIIQATSGNTITSVNQGSSIPNGIMTSTVGLIGQYVTLLAVNSTHWIEVNSLFGAWLIDPSP